MDKVSNEIPGLSSTDHSFQGLSRWVRTLNFTVLQRTMLPIKKKYILVDTGHTFTRLLKATKVPKIEYSGNMTLEEESTKYPSKGSADFGSLSIAMNMVFKIPIFE